MPSLVTGKLENKAHDKQTATVVVAQTKHGAVLDWKLRPEKSAWRQEGLSVPDAEDQEASAKGRPPPVDTTSAASPSSSRSPTGKSVGSPTPSALAAADVTVPPALQVVDRLPFNLWVVFVTFSNILIIATEMDSGPGPGASFRERPLWFMLEITVCINFAVEMAIRISCFTPRKRFFFDVWNALDFLLVCAAIFDTSILSMAGIGGDIRFFTVLRALRAVRLVKLVRMFATFRELWLLVRGLVESIRALCWVGVVVLIVLYVCSIVTTAEIGQKDDVYGIGPSYDAQIWPYKKYFGSVFKSMFTLFQIMTLDAWCDDIVRHVVYRQPVMGALFVIFLFMTAFGLMNIVVGIIIENTLAAAAASDVRVEEKKGEARKQAVERLHEVLLKSDYKKTGEISVQELRAANQSKIVQALFEKIGLVFDEVLEIFKLLDYEQRGRVEVMRFTDAFRELVGGAKRRDLAQVEITVGALAQHLEHLDQQFIRIEKDIGDLTHMTQDFVQRTVRVLTGFDGSVKVPPRSPRRGPSPMGHGLHSITDTFGASSPGSTGR